MQKRILTLILGVVIVLSALSPVAFGAQADDEPSCEAAISALKRFEMLGEDFEADEVMSFGDFVGLAMKLTGVSQIPVSEEPCFSDVPKSAKQVIAEKSLLLKTNSVIEIDGKEYKVVEVKEIGFVYVALIQAA